MVICRNAALFFSACLLILSVPINAMGDTGSADFSADYRFWHEPSGTVLDEARVIYSDDGLRVEQAAGEAGNVFIANYRDDAVWFLDRRRQLVHAVPVQVTSLESSPESSLESSENLSLNSPGHHSIIQEQPCTGLNAKRRGSSVLQGRETEHWSCTLDGVLIEEQWYAPSMGIVVRTESDDGFVGELSNIRRRQLSSAHFRPPSHFRAVKIEELINPAAPISSYIERVVGQPLSQ